MHWKFPKFDIKKIENISQKYNIPSLHAKIMISRGLEDENVIDSYFNKKLSNNANISARSRWPLDEKAPYLKGPGLKL